MVQVDIELVQPGFGFEATDASGLKARFDTSPDSGGQNFGIRPMQSLLMALGTCSGIDVLSILQKKRQQVDSYRMVIKGEREHDKIPALWKNAHVVFILNGAIEEEKARHAITLSIEKYCSVAETLRRSGCTITWELELNKQS